MKADIDLMNNKLILLPSSNFEMYGLQAFLEYLKMESADPKCLDTNIEIDTSLIDDNEFD